MSDVTLLPFAILDDEFAALRRFRECATDGDGHDVPKKMMVRLSEIGLVREMRVDVYEETVFGTAVLNGEFAALPPVSPQPDLQEYETFIDWAKSEGLIQESYGIRSVNSACAVAEKAWSYFAALAKAPSAKGAARFKKLEAVALTTCTDLSRIQEAIGMDAHMIVDADKIIEHIRALLASAPQVGSDELIVETARYMEEKRADFEAKFGIDIWAVQSWLNLNGFRPLQKYVRVTPQAAAKDLPNYSVRVGVTGIEKDGTIVPSPSPRE